MILRRCAGFILLLAPLAPAVRGDATMRYHIDVQVAPAIGAAASIDQVLGGVRDLVIRVKGNKAYSLQGNIASIMDLNTQDLIMVDAAHSRFATIPAGQYAEEAKLAASAIPEEARQVLSSMKTGVESHSTGRTATIQGIQAEEREFVLTLDMAMPGAPPLPGPFLKMTIQSWTAKPEETQRVAALQEFKNYTSSAMSAMNPADMIKQLVNAFPGLGDNIALMMKDLTKDGMALRTHTEIVMPLLAALSRQIPQQPGQPAPPALDSNAPLMQMTQELVEISTASVDDALFEVPAGYQKTTLDEILKGAASAALPPSFKQ